MKMSNCTYEEIAEKKRIALEKLKAKKTGLIQNKTTAPSRNLNNQQVIANINQTSAEIIKKTNSQENIENRASFFINSLKSSELLVKRQQQQHVHRDAIHPYKTSSDSRVHCGNKTMKESKKQVGAAVSINCKVQMITSERFEVQPSGYHAKLIEVFKSIASKSYDAVTRNWNFALKDYRLLQERILHLGPDIVFGSIPKAVFDICLSSTKEADKSCLISIEPTLSEKLMPFQEDGVRFAISRHGRAMICDEMGLGKTYQAIAIASFYQEDWPLLICTTASTRDSWANHIRELLPSLPVHYIQILSSSQQYINEAKVVITSYNMMERHISEIMECKFGFLIFDESHNLKNTKAKCTKVADRLSQQAKRLILLSGTPALSRPVELYSQLHIIDRKFMNFTDFTTRYCDGKQSNFGWDAMGQSNLKELNLVLKLKFMIRRTKAEVMKDMSTKIRELVILDPAIVCFNDHVRELMEAEARNLQSCKGEIQNKVLLKFYAQTAEIKIKGVWYEFFLHKCCTICFHNLINFSAYLKQIMEEEKKCIVFAHHRIMLDAICDCFSILKVKYIRIDGSTSVQDRGRFIDQFQKNVDCKAAVLSLGSCNSGITLTTAELIIFAELTWNPTILAQAESRAHRIGQQKPVICRYLMAKRTADDHIWNLLKAKQDILKKAGIFCENIQEINSTASAMQVQKNSPTERREILNSLSVKLPTSNKMIESSSVDKGTDVIQEFYQDDDELFLDIAC
uniref:SWI/SNF-related matrix-associated actin-dependent regulator of chromatin subfamily A-like protein 1 n=1 Tax=Glossina brevipalpis TaxID=37001 RepID=A0A1A9WKM5_9MUSC